MTYEEFNLLELRSRLGLAKTDLAKILGWSVAKIDVIEHGRRELTEAEYAHAWNTLSDRIGDAVQLEAEELKARDRIIRDTPTGATRLVEWNSLEYGDTVKVRGMPGETFTFLFHHTDAKQEYVQLYGGSNGHKLMRSINPERIISRSRSKTKETS